jgi:hypothetical protein
MRSLLSQHPDKVSVAVSCAPLDAGLAEVPHGPIIHDPGATVGPHPNIRGAIEAMDAVFTFERLIERPVVRGADLAQPRAATAGKVGIKADEIFGEDHRHALNSDGAPKVAQPLSR